ncbi:MULTISPECIES: hypothetical protein [Sphingobacterium]|uniref:hypothetical protein n=1 Tax=Sphingobacterium TaxID=28453 RepID=UPI00257EC728|nr:MULTISPECIES: hypothetical protein [Sphingobacterium]
MNKGTLKSGAPCLYYRTEVVITFRTFTTALADYFYTQGDIAKLDKLTKKRAEEILKTQIRLFGKQGEHQSGFFESTDEVGEEYNSTYDSVREWIMNKYPHLIEQTA